MAPLEAVIGSLALGGEGVAHIEVDGKRRAVFVPRTAPGDVVQLDVDFRTRPARGRVLALVHPGPDRVEPPCAWAAPCGGCDWMHLSRQAQSRHHVTALRGALPSSYAEVPVSAHASPDETSYRTRCRLHVRCGRGGRVVVGMHQVGTHQPVNVASCAVLDPRLDAARNELAALLAGARGRGEASLALGSRGLPVVALRWHGELGSGTFGSFERAIAQGRWAGARLHEEAAARPAIIGDPVPWIRSADGLPLRLGPGGFAQANEKCSEALGLHVASVVSDARAAHVVELYAGAGNLTVLLAALDSVTHLVAVESDHEACDANRANLAARRARRPEAHHAVARVVEGDAAEYALPAGTRIVLLDPPRTGAKRVAERLAASRVQTIVYVSCDPPTLGRDLLALDSSYAPVNVATFEMFPFTSHLETVVVLRRRRT